MVRQSWSPLTQHSYRRCTGVASAYEADRLVLMDAAGKRFYSTNAVGAVIWGLLGTPRSMESLCTELASRWESSKDSISQDVSAFLSAMIEARLIEMVATDVA